MKIRQRVIKVIEDTFGINIEDDGEPIHIKDDLCLDSIDKVELAMFVEVEFDIMISDEEEAELHTISDFVELFHKKTAHR